MRLKWRRRASEDGEAERGGGFVRKIRGGDGEDPGRRGRGFAVGFFIAIFLLLGGLYAGGYALTSDRVPREVSVSGVSIGGLTPDEAEQKLHQELAPRAHKPIRVRQGGSTYKVNPVKAGLSLDAAETVQSAGGGPSLNPLSMIEVLTGGEDVSPVLDVDDAALNKVVGRLADKVERHPVKGAITFRGGRAKPVYPTPGAHLDKEGTAEALQDAFLGEDTGPVDLPVDRAPTRLKDRDVDAAMSHFAEPAMSGPVTVRAGGRSVRIRPLQIGGALTMQAQHGRLVPRLDAGKLYRRAATRLAPLTDRPRPATVVLRDGRPHVVSGQVGSKLDRDQLAKRVRGVLGKTGTARSVSVGTRTLHPAFDTADARKLGIHQVVSHFTTYFPGDESYRNVNLGQAAANINGTVLKPGGVFSLNNVVGKRTAANGFTKGYIIDNGQLVEDFGGGVSQVATTTYNAGFFAGMKDLEHNPHSIYFDRYPMGRESTVVWGSKDMRFQNDTPYGVLVQAWIKKSTPSTYGQMHVRIWSTHYWDVKAGLSDQYDFTKPSVRYDTRKECLEETGYDGFDVDVYRYLSRNGHHVRTEKDHVSYDPLDTVRCHAPPKSNDQKKSGSGGGGG